MRNFDRKTRWSFALVWLAGVLLQVSLGLAGVDWFVAFVAFLVVLTGFLLGHARGFTDGLDFSYRMHLEGQLKQLDHLEEHAIEHFAPDAPERRQLAHARRELLNRLAKL